MIICVQQSQEGTDVKSRVPIIRNSQVIERPMRNSVLSITTEDHKVQEKPLHGNRTFPGVRKARSGGRLQVKLLPHYGTYFVFFVELIEAKVILSHLISINPIHMITFFLPYSNFLLQMAYLTALIVKSPKWFYMLKSRCWKNCVPFWKL